MFSCEFCEISKNTFFTEQHLETASNKWQKKLTKKISTFCHVEDHHMRNGTAHFHALRYRITKSPVRGHAQLWSICCYVYLNLNVFFVLLLFLLSESDLFWLHHRWFDEVFRCSVKKVVYKFRKIYRKHLCRDLAQVFSCEFCYIFKNTFFI